MGLHELHCKSDLDTSGLITTIWDGILEPQPSQALAYQRKIAFIRTASLSFAKKNRELEKAYKHFHRHAYTLYAPLHDKCEIGIAAAVMEMRSGDMIETQLDKVNNWELFPAPWIRVRYLLSNFKKIDGNREDGFSGRSHSKRYGQLSSSGLANSRKGQEYAS